MTDKQIIIDGVDVSGCKYRCDTHKTLLADGHIMEFENYCQITNDGCYAINCYYKQLKRKEQECERLNEWKKEHLKDVEFIESNPVIDILNSMANNILLEQQLDQLKAENEELTTINARLWDYLTDNEKQTIINILKEESK